MTNKEAIAELKAMPIIYPITNGENDRASRLMQARDMAIKALKQESCEDAISRQAVLDMMQMRMSGKELYKAVYDLPPVNPQPCGDLISRKAILEEFENDQYHLEFCKEHHIERSISMEMVRIRLHDLPPVNPQLCENAISRQTVLDIVDSYSESQSNVEDVTQDIISDIVALPPVNSQPCKDAIGREDMLDAIGHGTTYTSEELQRIIKGLPPVNPQKCDRCEVGNPCLYCKHEFEPQESERV